MSPGWYWYLGHLRGVLQRLQTQHSTALTATRKRVPVALDADMIAQRDASIAIEYIDRYRRTMEAASVLSPKG